MNKRKPYYAYQGWYPSNTDSLNAMIESSILNINVNKNELNINGLISPHAGYVYSLKTALYAYKNIIDKKYNNAFIFAPSHKSHCNGKVVLPEYDFFQTPLGDLKVNNEIISNIKNEHNDLFILNDRIHDDEHSLEMQLPLIYYSLKHISIIPIILPPLDLANLKNIGKIVGKFINQNDIIIISSDLSHFPTKTNADIIDKDAMNSWKDLDTNLIWKIEEKWQKSGKTSCAMCGISAIITGFEALKTKFNNLQVDLLNHSTSYDITKDSSSVVGYGAAVVCS